jgi:phosphate uptake regulator
MNPTLLPRCNRRRHAFCGLVASIEVCPAAATPLLWVAHRLERAADRVTNAYERAVFTVTGEMNELDVMEPPA